MTEEQTVVLQVMLPPKMELGSGEMDILAKHLLAGIEHYLKIGARVIFFTRGSAVYGFEEE